MHLIAKDLCISLFVHNACLQVEIKDGNVVFVAEKSIMGTLH